MRHLVLLFSLLLAACSPPSEKIEPETDRRALGQQPSVAVTVPLVWQSNADWTIDPLFGAAERAAECGGPDPDLHSLGIEIDAASLPTGSLVLGATLVIDPCDARGPWLPDNLPAFALFAVDRLGTPTQTASGAQDQSTDAASYSLPHQIAAQSFPNPVLVNREKHRYMVLFEPEHGAEATGGTRVTGLVLDVLLP